MIILYILILISSGISISQGFNPSDCDCGYKEKETIWNEMWYMNFEEEEGQRTFSDDNNKNLYSHKDLFFSNYEIPPKFNDSYPRVFRKENVIIRDGSLDIGITVEEDGTIRCGGIGTTRQDFLYGSFRSYVRTTPVEGTVAGMFVYHPEGEIDIELLSSVQPRQAYFAMHPGLTENGKASSLTHGNYILDFDPTQDFHEYRFDWFPDLTIFYVDGIEQYRMTTNVLSQPSRVMFNHWTDGNQNFSQGPAKENASLNVKNMTFFFNSTDSLISTPKCINVNSTCYIETIMNSLKGHETANENDYFLLESKAHLEQQPFFLLVLIIFLALLF